jgi:hypothetical protein
VVAEDLVKDLPEAEIGLVELVVVAVRMFNDYLRLLV